MDQWLKATSHIISILKHSNFCFNIFQATDWQIDESSQEGDCCSRVCTQRSHWTYLPNMQSNSDDCVINFWHTRKSTSWESCLCQWYVVKVDYKMTLEFSVGIVIEFSVSYEQLWLYSSGFAKCAWLTIWSNVVVFRVQEKPVGLPANRLHAVNLQVQKRHPASAWAVSRIQGPLDHWNRRVLEP